MPSYLLAIDQGTTSSRAIILSQQGKVISQHQMKFTQHFPQDGWVEHDPEEIWQTVITCMQQALQKAALTANAVQAIGISNQRETTVVWDRATGKAIYPAIVWQDRRTADHCLQLAKDSALSQMITQKTGLLLDPYFSATKIAWLLEHVEGAKQRALKGELAFGTIDSYLVWRLSGGQRHVTDATNASRTLLFNIHTQQWDQELLELLAIPPAILPDVLDNCADFAMTDATLLGHSIPITGIAGDQQAALIGQACFTPGMIKSTYGTGCFVFLNTGDEVVYSQNRLLATTAYRIAGKATYGLEGSIFMAGATIQWLCESLHFMHHVSDSEKLAATVADTGGVYLVPAFTGLGAPYWDPKARGALLGLTRDSSSAHIVRAGLEAVCYQTQDLMQAMAADYSGELHQLRVDGGMTANHWLLQFLADILALPIERPSIIETSVVGAAMLAGLGIGWYDSLADIAAHWQLDRQFQPQMDEQQRAQLYQGWQVAVRCVTRRDW